VISGVVSLTGPSLATLPRYARATVAGSWRWVGDRALLRTVADREIVDANRAMLALAHVIRALDLDEIDDVVPGARSLLIVLRAGVEPSVTLTDALERDDLGDAEVPAARHDVPVRYGGEDGPDLDALAGSSGVSVDDVIALHTAPTYVVAFIGFSPGFPYLIGLPDELARPRLATPRTRVPSGSVGIGGPYTGIYPSSTPGGWHLIGRTELELFDAGRVPPARLLPGDQVRFIAR